MQDTKHAAQAACVPHAAIHHIPAPNSRSIARNESRSIHNCRTVGHDIHSTTHSTAIQTPEEVGSADMLDDVHMIRSAGMPLCTRW
jgi:hypothetical protein